MRIEYKVRHADYSVKIFSRSEDAKRYLTTLVGAIDSNAIFLKACEGFAKGLEIGKPCLVYPLPRVPCNLIIRLINE